MNMSTPAITVIVPTHNRPESLKRCLGHIAAQKASEPVEILVVDDGSDDEDLVADAVARTPGARLIRQERRGAAAARNTGVRAAGGSFICFTDDDCEAAPDWVSRLACARDRGEHVVAGVTMNGGGESRVAFASELLSKYFAEHSSVPFAASNNLGATIRLLRDFPFDESYVDAGGEDRDWCYRLTAGGYRIVRDPDAVVVHHEPQTLRAYIGQHARYGRGSYHYHRTPACPRRLERPSFYTEMVRQGFRAGPSVGLLVAAAQWATAIGYVGEWVGVRAPTRTRSVP
jgi:glycosyltransferase involved in cell wall biosynthesis